MNANWKNRMPVVFAAVLLAVALLISSRAAPARADREAAASGPARYHVVETEGHNLIVTDNGTNTLYFYTIDKDKPIGSDLKLRGSVDLTQVGKPVLTPTKTKKDE